MAGVGARHEEFGMQEGALGWDRGVWQGRGESGLGWRGLMGDQSYGRALCKGQGAGCGRCLLQVAPGTSGTSLCLLIPDRVG